MRRTSPSSRPERVADDEGARRGGDQESAATSSSRGARPSRWRVMNL
jgi:hypothetical protein